MLGSPIHEIGRVFIWTKEENLRVFSSRDIDDWALDTGRLTGDQQINDGLRGQQCSMMIILCRVTHVDGSLEGLLEVGIELRKDGSLGSSFGDILVLCIVLDTEYARSLMLLTQVLGRGQSVVLVKESSDVGVVVPRTLSVR